MKEIFNHLNYDWQNIKVLSKNRLLTRPFYASFTEKEKALSFDKNNSSHYTSLNGIWKFKFYESPFELPENIMKEDYASSSMDEITVPILWQFEGHGRPQYTDDIAVVPMQKEPVVSYENPTGVYRRNVNIDKSEELKYILRFDGVESAYHVYVNGDEVGYSQVSRNTSEFDVTEFLNDGDNLLTVIVYQYSEGFVLEIQDMWTLGGIFRDVSLITTPKVVINDYKLVAGLGNDYKDGKLNLEIHMTNFLNEEKDLDINIQIFDKDKEILSVSEKVAIGSNNDKSIIIKKTLQNIKHWTAETPNLYYLLITTTVDGKAEYYSQRFGFRTLELREDGLMYLNGKYFKLKGMNRHDWSGDTGRTITVDQMRQDLYIMKNLNINSVRTAHYPNMPEFYELCDELGFYLISEADLECNQFIHVEDGSYLSQSTKWKEAYVDRVERMVRRDKNVTSILIWSLGNESSYGLNMKASYDFCKAYDKTRLVHYEEDKQAISADMYSSMYTKHELLEKIGQNNELGKPHILCEYAHSMGNSPGGIEEYWEIINKYDRIQGAYVWEWIAHGIKAVDKNGVEYFKYGGDFGEYPHTGKFCTSGMIGPDRYIYPGAYQLKKALEPIKTTIDFNNKTINIKNLFNYKNIDEYKLTCTIKDIEKTIDTFEVDITGINPMKNKEVKIELKDTYIIKGTEAFIDFTYSYKEKPAWGFDYDDETVITVTQFQLPNNLLGIKEEKETKKALEVESTLNHRKLTVSVDNKEYIFNVAKGVLSNIKNNGVDMLQAPIEMNFWRAPIDNDRNQETMWKKYLVDTIQTCPIASYIKEDEFETYVIFETTFAPMTKDWKIDVVMTYKISQFGLSIEVHGTPTGNLPDTLPRVGIVFAMNKEFEKVNWFGHGPHSNYTDSKLGTPIGSYEKNVKEMYIPYVVPQEHATRSGVRKLVIKDIKNVIDITSSQPFLFSASNYSTDALTKATHTNELVEEDMVWITLDYKQHGLGSASWGPDALPNAILKPEEFKFDFNIKIDDEY